MIGRLKDKIVPAVRFGNISVMLELIWNSTVNKDQLSFAVEMRSRTGFSGSFFFFFFTAACERESGHRLGKTRTYGARSNRETAQDLRIRVESRAPQMVKRKVPRTDNP